MDFPVSIPDKLFFKIGEVSRITDLKPHVLRYWESEFSSIRPTKSRTNQRAYQRKDIETILLIKHLLYDKKFTIEGARTRLKELRSKPEVERAAEAFDSEEMKRELNGIREELVDLLDHL